MINRAQTAPGFVPVPRGADVLAVAVRAVRDRFASKHQPGAARQCGRPSPRTTHDRACHYGFVPDFSGMPTIRSPRASSRTRAATPNATWWFQWEICAIPNERLNAELELLRPLPSVRLRISAPSVLRKIGAYRVRATARGERLRCVHATARYGRLFPETDRLLAHL